MRKLVAAFVLQAVIVWMVVTPEARQINRPGEFSTLTATGLSTLVGITSTGAFANSFFGTNAFTAGGIGGNIFGVRNTTNNAGSYAEFQLGNDADAQLLYVRSYSSSYTPSGAAFASGSSITNEGAGGLALQAQHATGVIRFYTGGATLAGTVSAAQNWSFVGSVTAPSYINGARLLISSTAPTVSSGFGTSPSISGSASSFRLDVGTGGVATGGVLGMPTATTGWNCSFQNLTGNAANRADSRVVQTASTASGITLQNQTISTGAALAFTASDIVAAICFAY